jgi:biofilm PGA synthesis N-glycosyltransferase PgaC
MPRMSMPSTVPVRTRTRIGPADDVHYAFCTRRVLVRRAYVASMAHRAPPSDGYVIVTAARNAAPTIGAVISAVAAQLEQPTRWVIVSDGSSDDTVRVVEEHARTRPWIQLLVCHRDGPASYAAKAHAVSMAYRAAQDAPHGIVANLDADIVIPPDYYLRCRQALAAEPDLGITGGAIVESIAGRRTHQRSSPRSVAGGIQTFRRECWDRIGQGYLPLECGGEDAVAEVLARAHGFRVATVPALEAEHFGPVLGGRRGRVRARAARGVLHRQLGHRPWFQLASAAARINEPPAVVGSVATLAGYGWATIRRVPLSPPPEIVDRIRAEHAARVRPRLHLRALESA